MERQTHSSGLFLLVFLLTTLSALPMYPLMRKYLVVHNVRPRWYHVAQVLCPVVNTLLALIVGVGFAYSWAVREVRLHWPRLVQRGARDFFEVEVDNNVVRPVDPPQE